MTVGEELGRLKAYLEMYFEEKITLEELQAKVSIPFKESEEPKEDLPWET